MEREGWEVLKIGGSVLISNADTPTITGEITWPKNLRIHARIKTKEEYNEV